MAYMLIHNSYGAGQNRGFIDVPVVPILGAALGLMTLFGLAHAFWAPVFP